MTDLPLRGVRVLIPRVPGRGEALAARVDAAGGHAVVAPLISRADVDGADLRALRDSVAALRAGEYAWVAITSVNAVVALLAAAETSTTDTPTPPADTSADASAQPSADLSAERSADLSPDASAELGPSTPSRAFESPSSQEMPELDDGSGGGGGSPGSPASPGSLGSRGAVRGGLGGWPVRWAAVGPATARALRRAGVEPELVAAENSAVGMLAEWPSFPAVTAAGPASASRPRVLLPLGDLAEPTLERGLAERGYAPVRVTAYRTVSHPAPPEVVADWSAGRTQIVVLTSGSVAREVARQLGARSDVLAVAIGQPTRRAAEGTGQRVAAVATGATDDALFSAIIEAARLLPTTHPEDQ